MSNRHKTGRSKVSELQRDRTQSRHSTATGTRLSTTSARLTEPPAWTSVRISRPSTDNPAMISTGTSAGVPEKVSSLFLPMSSRMQTQCTMEISYQL